MRGKFERNDGIKTELYEDKDFLTGTGKLVH